MSSALSTAQMSLGATRCTMRLIPHRCMHLWKTRALASPSATRAPPRMRSGATGMLIGSGRKPNDMAAAVQNELDGDGCFYFTLSVDTGVLCTERSWVPEPGDPPTDGRCYKGDPGSQPPPQPQNHPVSRSKLNGNVSTVGPRPPTDHVLLALQFQSVRFAVCLVCLCVRTKRSVEQITERKFSDCTTCALEPTTQTRDSVCLQ